MRDKIRYVLTGAAFVAIGIALWGGLLFSDSIWFFLTASSTPKHQPVHPGEISEAILQCYPLMFVIATWIVARQKVSSRNITAYPIAYTIFVAAWLGFGCRLNPHPIPTHELIGLLVPIPLSVLTAILVGARKVRQRPGPGQQRL